MSYGEICNEHIDPCVPISEYPTRFEMPTIDKFKSKENPKEHLWHFKHSCYMIAHGNALLLRTFPMTLGGQVMNWYNTLS